MLLIFFSPTGWERWDVERKPLIRTGLPVLIDDDLQFENEHGPRACATANRWLRELPITGRRSPNTWEAYARALKGWLEFLAEHDIEVFGCRAELRAALNGYVEYRLAGPLDARLAESSWNLHTGALSQFYDWAVAEGYASAVPFSYSTAKRIVRDRVIEVRRNLVTVRQAKSHTTIKYLEADFAELFVRALEGLLPDGAPNPGFRGHNPSRNAAVADLVLASGLRRTEFTYLLVYEVPALPPAPTSLPILFPVPRGITKGRKQRTTWISYKALAVVHRYLLLERRLAVECSAWRPAAKLGEPLWVTSADPAGGTINGRRRAWASLTRDERLRLVDQAGGSLLLAVQRDGAPFVDWSTVFRRASDEIRDRFEPRFPHVNPHRLRHSFALATLERLVAGYYREAAALVARLGDDAALSLYLTKADPMEVLRDLLGHSSVLVTEVYLRRLDTTRVFREAAAYAGKEAGLSPAIRAEVEAEFVDEDDVDELAAIV